MALIWVKFAAELLDNFLLRACRVRQFLGLALHAREYGTENGVGEQEAQMTYHFSKTVNMRFDDAVASAKEALKRHNFRVLTEIDMKDNFKKGLNVDFRPYLILGACNPQLTYRALQAEDKIGTRGRSGPARSAVPGCPCPPGSWPQTLGLASAACPGTTARRRAPRQSVLRPTSHQWPRRNSWCCTSTLWHPPRLSSASSFRAKTSAGSWSNGARERPGSQLRGSWRDDLKRPWRG